MMTVSKPSFGRGCGQKMDDQRWMTRDGGRALVLSINNINVCRLPLLLPLNRANEVQNDWPRDGGFRRLLDDGGSSNPLRSPVISSGTPCGLPVFVFTRYDRFECLFFDCFAYLLVGP